MALRAWILAGALVATLGYLAYEVSDQDRRIDELEKVLAANDMVRPQTRSTRGLAARPDGRKRENGALLRGPTPSAQVAAPWLRAGKRIVESDASSVGLGDDEVAERVREIVRDEQEAMEEERAQRRRDRWEARARRRLGELAEAVQLPSSAQEEILQLWSAEYTQIRSLFRDGRTEGRDFGELRQEMRQLFQETDAQVRSMLSEEQFAAYEEARRSMQRRGRGGPGPGGRGPGGPGPGG